MRDTLKRQKVNTKEEFDERLKQVSTEFAEQVRRRGGGGGVARKVWMWGATATVYGDLKFVFYSSM